MALVAVLWTLVALATAALALGQQARLHTQRLQQQAEQLRAQALAQAAMVHLLASGAFDAEVPRPAVRQWRVTFAPGQVAAVELRSAAHAVDLNHAPRDLLAAVLHHLGQLGQQDARTWADAIVAYREQTRSSRMSPYQSVQDLQVHPGLPLSVWTRIESALTVDSESAAVDPWAVDDELLIVLAQGDRERAATWAAERRAGQTPDWSVVPAAWIARPTTSRWMAQATVPVERGVVRVRWWWVRGATPDGLPWKLLRTRTDFIAEPP